MHLSLLKNVKKCFLSRTRSA